MNGQNAKVSPDSGAEHEPPQGLRPRRPERLAWLPIPLLAAAIIAGRVAGLRESYTSETLTLLLSITFYTLVSVGILFLIGRSFLASGRPGLLLLECGVILWSLAGTVGDAVSHGDANINVTIFNTGIFLAGLCHLAGAILSLRTQRVLRATPLWLGTGSALALGALWLVTWAALANWLPVFFIPGQGGTLVRYCVLISAITMFVLSAGLLLASQRAARLPFTFWYALALLLLAVGLFGVMIQLSLGSVVNWLGRTAQWLGGVYLFLASVASLRESNLPIIPAENKPRPESYNYGVAIAIVIAATAVRFVLAPALGTRAPFLIFYPAVILAALYGGLRAGLLATVFSALVVYYFRIGSFGQFTIGSPADWVSLLFFFLACTMISFIVEMTHRARARAAEADTKALIAAERVAAAEILKKSEARFKLLSNTAWRLLATDNPQGIVNELCREVMAHLDCQVFFNFLVDEDAGWLRLNTCAGISEEEVRKIERLDYGTAVCGCVARDGAPIIAENIFNVPDLRTELVKSYGVQAYACHPLKVGSRLIGTLSFGTKTRPSFSSEDIALMKTVTDQVSTAMERMRLIKELQRSRDELETRVQERTRELESSHQRLQQLTSQLLQAQEKERKRVANELHDSLLSELAAMKFLFEGKLMLLKRGQLGDPKEFDRITDLMQKVMKDARGIMNNLRPSILDEMGLIPTIDWHVGEYQKTYGHIQIRKQVEVLEKDIPEILKPVIFRVLQEALNNFARHGGGDRVELFLLRSANNLHLKIQDNGQGFDVENIRKGLGLESMRERVEISGGEFQVDSVIGQGTTIRANWKV